MNIDVFVSKYFQKPTRIGDGAYKAICPLHSDHTPSISITQKGNAILINCPVCMTQENHDAKIRELANTFPSPNEFWKDLLGENYTIDTQKDSQKDSICNYTLEDYAREKKLNTAFLSQLNCKTGNWTTKKGYDYLCLEIPYFSIDSKSIQCRYRVGFKSGKRKVWDKEGNKNMIYGLWQIPDFATRSFPQYPETTPYLIIVEGESDCQTLWSAGFPAIGLAGCNKNSRIDSDFQEQGITPYLDKFKVIYLVMEDDNGRKAFYPHFRRCSFSSKIRCIQFRSDIDTPSKGTPDSCKDPSELFCCLNGDVQAFQAKMQDIFSKSVPIENYQFSAEQTPDFKLESDKEDKRKTSSPKNGKKGGRPSGAANYMELADFLTQNNDDIKKYKQYEGQLFKWNETENRYAETSKEEFGATVMGVLQDLFKDGTLEAFNVSYPTEGAKKAVICQLLSKKFLVIDSEKVKEGHYINGQHPNTLLKAVKNGIIDIRGMALELYKHWNDKEEIEVSRYFFKPSMDFFNYTSLDQVTFNLHESCPQTDDILRHLLQEEQIKAYWQHIAFALLEDFKPNKFYVFYGKSGTGKSTVGLGIPTLLFGNSGIRLKWNDLDNESSKFKVATLAENNIAMIDEMPDRLNKFSNIVSFIKDVTNGSYITTEKKGQNPQKSRAKALLVFATNTLNLFHQSAKRDETAIFERAIPILFDTKVRNTENENTQINIILEQELSGILNRVLRALGEIIDNGYKAFLPQKSKEKLELCMKCKNPFDLFINDCCEISANRAFKVKSLYDDFRRYMEELREPIMPFSDFLETLYVKEYQIEINEETKERYTNIQCKKYGSNIL